MINTSFLSMWISNLAATALMLPIVDAVLVQLRHRTRSIASVNDRKRMKFHTFIPKLI
jgi:di/tricarboxylate transporter